MGRKRDYRDLEKGYYYHIYNRGNRKDPIGLCPKDFRQYVQYMKRRFFKYSHIVVAYCIMPNHYHLIAKVNDQRKFIKAIQYFSASCATYFNKKYNAVGHMFQDKYKHRKLSDDLDLIYLSRYIHMNPAEIIGKKNILNYKFSSLQEYLSPGRDRLLKKEDVLKYFKSNEAYRSFITNDQFKNQIVALKSDELFTDRLYNQLIIE